MEHLKFIDKNSYSKNKPLKTFPENRSALLHIQRFPKMATEASKQSKIGNAHIPPLGVPHASVDFYPSII